MKKETKKEIKDNIIYKDDNKIKNNVKLIHQCVNALNHNYTKVKEYNAYLSYKVAYYLTFYKNYMDIQKQRFLDDRVKEEIAKLLSENNPFNSAEMVDGFFNELKQSLFLTREMGMWFYRNDLPLKSLKFDDMKFCERFVQFDEKNDEFIMNENEILAMMDELTYKAQNDKQQKALDILKNINAEIEELDKIGLKNLFTINTKKGRFCTKLRLQDFWRTIQNLK